MASTRREFLKCGACIPLGWALRPYLLKAMGNPEFGDGNPDNILVVVQLSGGNDGLNTLVPYADEQYYKHRRVIGIRKDAVLRLNDELGFHPSMKALKQLYDKGHLAVVQGVGYPNPSRSHFRSSDIWESGFPDREENKTGWIGRALDQAQTDEQNIPSIAAGESNLPLSLIGSKPGAVSVLSIDSFRLQSRTADAEQQKRALQHLASGKGAGNSRLEFLQNSSQLAFRCSERIEGLEQIPTSGSEIGKRLQLVAQLIQARLGTRIFHVSLGGFDTHAEQTPTHSALLLQLSDAIESFYKKLEKRGEAQRVLLMAYSEFGRRLSENASRGTDHGSAAPVILVNPSIRAGIHGARLDLQNLEDGDPRFTVDFRSVYATVLENWMGWNSSVVLGSTFAKLNLL